MVDELAEDLAAAGHDVTVVTGWPSHPRGKLFDGWKCRFRQVTHDPKGYALLRCRHSFGPRKRMSHRLWYYFTFAVTSFINTLALRNVDVIICASTPIFGSWSDWLLARLKGARFVYDISDLRPEAMLTAGMITQGRLYGLLKAQDTWVCRRADLITTLSENLRKGIEARGIAPDKIRVIPFWLDGRKIQPQDRDNPWRREQGIPTSKFVALFAGTIGYVSGAEMLVDVAQALSGRDDILLLVVGEGPVKDSLQRRAEELRLANMRFLPFQPAEVLNQMQATADVGLVTLLPDAGENSVPSKMLGYLAAGRPVIASVSESSPTAQAIVQGRCGLVAPPQDSSAMAAAILQLADDHRQLAEMGCNAREFFLRCFDRQGSVAQWQMSLTALCQRGKARIGDPENGGKPR